MYILLLGYGDSSGSPSEEGMVEDAMSIFRWLKIHSGGVPIYLWGHSLGAACVSNLFYFVHLSFTWASYCKHSMRCLDSSSRMIKA